MKVTITSNNGNKTFHHKRDAEDGKAAFQWVYGYWPTDDQVVSVEDDGPRVEMDDNGKDQVRSMREFFSQRFDRSL